MPNPHRNQQLPSSPRSSTLSYAASFALPTSRSNSPAAHRANIASGSGEIGGGGSGSAGGGGIGIAAGGFGNKGGAGSGVGITSAVGRLTNTRGLTKEKKRHSDSWDDAWDSSSDTESPSSAVTRPTPLQRPVPPKQSSSYLSLSSSRNVSSSTPISFNRPSIGNEPTTGVGNGGEQLIASSSSSGNIGVGSWKEVSPPSPGGWEGNNGQGVYRTGVGVAGGVNAIGKTGLSKLVSLAGASGGLREGVSSNEENQSQSHSPATPRRIAGFVSQSSNLNTISSSIVDDSLSSSSGTTKQQYSSMQTIIPEPQPNHLINAKHITPDPASTLSITPTTTTTDIITAAPSQAGENWTLIQGDEIQEAERAFKGLDIQCGEEQKEEKASRGSVKGKERVGKEVIKDDILEILADPLYSLKFMANISSPSTSDLTHASGSGSASVKRTRSVRSERRRDKFVKVLEGKERNGYGGRYGGVESAGGPSTSRAGGVDAAELRKLAWSGIPPELRPIAWQMLLNYLPLPSQPRLTTLHRKRREYAQLVEQAFGRGLSSMEANIWHQIEIDVPRTRPGVPLWSCETTQRSLERILYVWAIRHPASGYVQGINDLVTPFFEVFLGAYIDCDPELFDVSHLPEQVLAAIEADSFWCLSKLLDGIQDNYTFAQPGIQRLVRRMCELVRRIDAPLAFHLEEQGVEFMQFAFRWMNCLLMREISVKCTIRMWDTYLSEGTDAFSQFHLYVCSAFLVKWSEKLREMDFQEIIMFLQCLPTQSWADHDVELLLSEAFVLKSVWQGAENHFMGLPVVPLGGGMGGRQ